MTPISEVNFHASLRKFMNLYTKKQTLFWPKAVLSIGGLLMLLIFLNMFQAQARNSFYKASSPLSGTLLNAGNTTSSFLNSFLTFSATQQQNASLRQENEQLFSQIARLEDTISQDMALQQAVMATKEEGFALVAAQTIGLDLAADTMTINKGSADGVTEKMALISKEKVVYGKVSKVYQHFSQITLFSQKGSVLNVKIQHNDADQSPVYGAVKGNGAGETYLDLVNSDASIAEGDVLVTSGLEGIYPKNLLVAKIISTDQNDAQAFQTAQIQPFFDINDLENVFLITNYKTK